MKGLLLKEKTSIQNTSKHNIVIDHNEAKNLTREEGENTSEFLLGIY